MRKLFQIVAFICLALAPAVHANDSINADCFQVSPVEAFQNLYFTPESRCQPFQSIDNSTHKLFSTRFCKATNELSVLTSEAEQCETLIPSILYQTTLSIPTVGAITLTKDALIGILGQTSSSWTLTIRKISALDVVHTVSIPMPITITHWSLTDTAGYFVIFLAIPNSNGNSNIFTINEALFLVDKQTGALRWTTPFVYYQYNVQSQFSVGARGITQLPNGKFFIAWQRNKLQMKSIFYRIFGPNSGDTGTEVAFKESTGPESQYELNSVGVVNGNHYIFYTEHDSNLPEAFYFWRNSKTPIEIEKRTYISSPKGTTVYPYFLSAHLLQTEKGDRLAVLYRMADLFGVELLNYRAIDDTGTTCSYKYGTQISSSNVEISTVNGANGEFYFMVGLTQARNLVYAIGSFDYTDLCGSC